MPAPGEKPKEYIEASLTVPRDIQEAVCDFIIENYSNGLVLEEEDGADQTGIKFYIPGPGRTDYRQALPEYINQVSPDLTFTEENIRTKIVADVEWEQTYRESVKPIVVDNVIIRPPWASSGSADKIELIIEPKMAFGTGRHETTKLCIREILKYVKCGYDFLDLGCGSGILSILAARLGARRVKAVDTDGVAVQNCRENIFINGVTNVVEVCQGSIEQVESDPPYDFLVANIIRSTIISLYERIHASVKPEGVIVLSGLLEADEAPIVETISEFGFLKYDIKQDGQWLAVKVIKK
ncbi:MAG: 50S ribosomal protein L11 methyltransferase [Candidatus Zixiibacteriota bacterium]|nr:MAG: 50S ribosomal protein L11 methyltransferase [candidate division Zixibacteria bacterium]